MKLGERFIIGGDFNAKNKIQESRLNTPKGERLHQALVNLKCEFISTGKPTYWPTDIKKIPDVIDIYIYKNISSNFLHIGEVHELNSDHTAMVLSLSEHIVEKEEAPMISNKFTYYSSLNTIWKEE